MRRVLFAVPALLLAACGTSPVTGPADSTARPPAGTYTTSVTALAQKAESIAADGCTTRSAAQVYLDCARYVAEAGNLALAAQSAGATSAPKLADAVKRFSSTGCVAAPGVAGPPASTCGAVMADIQAGVKALKTELTALSAKPT
jgi:hypothetical protein